MTLPQAVNLYSSIIKLEENEIYLQAKAISLAFSEKAGDILYEMKMKELYQVQNNDNLTYSEEDLKASEEKAKKYLRKVK